MKNNYIFVLTTVSALIILNRSPCIWSKSANKRGVMDNLNDGLKIAGQMFGINTAADVANMVAKAFSRTATRNPSLFQPFDNNEYADQQSQYSSTSQGPAVNRNEYPSDIREDEAIPNRKTPSEMKSGNLISSILKMIGFDAGKLGALAINALIMVAQAIGTTFMPKTAYRRHVDSVFDGDGDREQLSTPVSTDGTNNDEDQMPEPRTTLVDSPIDWFLENPTKEMRHLLRDITDAKLSDKLTHMIEQLETKAEEGACIKMLMCKSSPFIWGMQKSLEKRLEGQGNAQQNIDQKEELQQSENFMSVKGFFTHLPSLEEFRKHGKLCQQRYANYCNTTNLYN